MRWWDQKGIDWEKAKARGAATESESESEIDRKGGAARDTDSRAIGSSGAEWSGASADKWSECIRVGSKLVHILHKDRV